MGGEVSRLVAVDALNPPSTSDVIALAAIVLAAVGAVIAYRQFRAAKEQLQKAGDTARAQFLLDMDQAFEADEAIRVRLAQCNQPPLTTEEWRRVKRYMARFERVSVFVQTGLMDPAVVYRLYGARFRNIVKNPQIRTRLLTGDKAASWVDFTELWRRLDEISFEETRFNLCRDVKPPDTARSVSAGPVVPTEEFDDEAGAAPGRGRRWR